MRQKFTGYRLQFTVFVIFFFLILLSPRTYNLKPAFAATPCGSGTTFMATGLVTAPSITSGSVFNTSGGCAIDPKSALAPFAIPSFDDLKSLYFTQSKGNTISITGDATQANLTASQNSIYSISGNLTLSGNPAATAPVLIAFVNGNLNINANYTYGGAQSGTVFIVKGNVIIGPSVTEIDAIIISSGDIYTAGANCSKNSVQASVLTVNGSLISLNPDTTTSHIHFCRTLSSGPSETINNQPKYLVILRSLLASHIQKWSEIGPDVVVPNTISFDFNLSNGGAKIVGNGQSVTQNITVNISSGTPQSVAFSVSGLPAGATALFDSTSCLPTPTSCTNILTLTAANTAVSSVSTITVTATAGNVTKTSTFSLTVNGFDFSLTNGGAKTVAQNSSATNTVTVALSGGVTQTVSLSASGLPAGATAAFSPTSCNPNCTSTLTIQTLSSTPLGTYPITVTGTGGGLTHTTNFNLTVSAFDFSLTNGGNKTVSQGSSVTNSITVNLSAGTTQSVSLSASGLPAGATTTFSPSSCSPTCSSTLTISTLSSTPTGTSTITVTGTGGGQTHTSTFTLSVTTSPFPSSSLVAYWKMDEASGTTVADSTGVNNGTATGTAVAQGKLGNGRNFNGTSSDYISVPNNASLGLIGDLSIGAWVKPTNFSAYMQIAAKTASGVAYPNPYRLEIIQTNGALRLWRGNGTSTQASAWSGANVVSTGAWSYVVVTQSGTNVAFYINGLPAGTGTISTTTTDGGQPLFIAKDGEGHFFNGLIDEVGVWNRALSSTEITNLYNGGAGLTYP